MSKVADFLIECSECYHWPTAVGARRRRHVQPTFRCARCGQTQDFIFGRAGDVPHPAPSPKEVDKHTGRQPARILVVEDDPLIRTVAVEAP